MSPTKAKKISKKKKSSEVTTQNCVKQVAALFLPKPVVAEQPHLA